MTTISVWSMSTAIFMVTAPEKDRLRGDVEPEQRRQATPAGAGSLPGPDADDQEHDVGGDEQQRGKRIEKASDGHGDLPSGGDGEVRPRLAPPDCGGHVGTIVGARVEKPTAREPHRAQRNSVS